MAVVSDQAVGVGVTAVPTPITDLGSSLFFLYQMFIGNSSSQVDLTLPANIKFLDSKAMRKVEVGSDLIVTVQNSSIGGG